MIDWFTSNIPYANCKTEKRAHLLAKPRVKYVAESQLYKAGYSL